MFLKSTFVLSSLLTCALIGAWELVVRVFHVKKYLVPAPSRVASTLWQQASVLRAPVAATAKVAFLGLLLGMVVAVVLAVPISLAPALRRAATPLLIASQSVPPFVFAPILIVWLGFGPFPRTLVVALVVFFPVLISTIDGLAHPDPDLAELMRSMAASPAQTLLKLRAPSAIRPFFAGLKIGAAYATFGAVIAEWTGAEEGLGLYLNHAEHSYRNDRVFAAVVLIAAVSGLLYALVHLAAHLIIPKSQP